MKFYSVTQVLSEGLPIIWDTLLTSFETAEEAVYNDIRAGLEAESLPFDKSKVIVEAACSETHVTYPYSPYVEEEIWIIKELTWQASNTS